mgnify:CR=1 FL=1
MKNLFCLFLSVTLLVGGCSSPTCQKVLNRTTIDYVNVGLNPDQLVSLFDAAHKDKGKITKKRLEELGLNFGSKNLLTASGSSAFITLFGPNVYQEQIQHLMKDGINEIDGYLLVQPLYRAVTNRASRLYVNKQVKTAQGPDLQVNILLKDDVVVYASIKSITHDSRQVNWRLGGGIIDLFGEAGSAVGAIAKPRRRPKFSGGRRHCRLRSRR